MFQNIAQPAHPQLAGWYLDGGARNSTWLIAAKAPCNGDLGYTLQKPQVLEINHQASAGVHQMPCIGLAHKCLSSH